MRLSNSELMILEIVRKEEWISGYDIDKLVKKRDYKEWAGVGTMSIYRGLKKMESSGLLKSKIVKDRNITGPKPKKFYLTNKGRKVLKKQILEALSSTRERDKRFDLGFAAIDCLKKKELLQAITKRTTFLKNTFNKVRKTYHKQGGSKLPLNIRFLFHHSFYLIEKEQSFLKSLIRTIEDEF